METRKAITSIARMVMAVILVGLAASCSQEEDLEEMTESMTTSERNGDNRESTKDFNAITQPRPYIPIHLRTAKSIAASDLNIATSRWKSIIAEAENQNR